MHFESVESVQALFARDGYVADRSLAITVRLAMMLGKPILLEGEAGVGKTEVAKVLAHASNASVPGAHRAVLGPSALVGWSCQ